MTFRELEEAPEKVRDVINKIPQEHQQLISLNEDARSLANKYITEEAIPKKYIVDAQHIALATVNNIDALVSWNFEHIVNLERIKLYNSVNLKYGYPIIEIRTPREVIHEG